MRESMVFYQSFAKAIKLMPEELQLQALWSIIDYGLDGVEPDPVADAYIKMVFQMAKPQIDSNIKRKINGSSGGRPKTIGYSEDKPVVTDSENHGLSNEKPNVNENVNENVKRVRRFTPPTPDDVREYCQKMGYTHVDADKFVDTFSAKGWRVGKTNTPMKDWKASVRNWERQEKEWREEKAAKTQSKSSNRFKNFEERKYSQNDYNKIIWGDLAKPGGEGSS